MESKTYRYSPDVIHIGIQKCASTFLQEIGFKDHPEICLLGDDAIRLECRELKEYAFSYDAERLRSALQNDEKKNRKSEHQKSILSFEGLSGNIDTGRDSRKIAEELAATFDQVQIIVILREQFGMMYSLWNQYIQGGGTLTLKGYLTHEASPAKPLTHTDSPPYWYRRPNNIYTRLQYHIYIQQLRELFGEKQVQIFFLEDMIRDYASFMKSMYDFIGVDSTFLPPQKRVRASFSPLLANIFRLSNLLNQSRHNQMGVFPYQVFAKNRKRFAKINTTWAFHRNLQKKPNISKIVPPDMLNGIKESNRILANMVGRDLSDLGYRL